MKAVILSLRPQWCEKIFNGSKTIEVRKSRPSLDMPFKVYVYQTKHNGGKAIVSEVLNSVYGGGKVIGSFVCDRVCLCIPFGLKGHLLPQKVYREMCLTKEQLDKYGGLKTLYGWHISDLKIYDKPKELREFCVPCKKYNDSELHCMEWDCKHYSFLPGANGDAEEECLCNGNKPLRRPPQSWCYVEELQ